MVLVHLLKIDSFKHRMIDEYFKSFNMHLEPKLAIELSRQLGEYWKIDRHLLGHY